MTRDAELYRCTIGRIRFKRHSAREKRKDAKAIMKAQDVMTRKLRAEVDSARYESKVPIIFRGLSGKTGVA